MVGSICSPALSKGEARLGVSGSVRVPLGRQGQLWNGEDWSVQVMLGRHGTAWLSSARFGWAGQGRRGMVCCGWFWQGLAGQGTVRHGRQGLLRCVWAARGLASLGRLGLLGLGKVRHGKARFGRHGLLRCVRVRHGLAWYGKAGNGRESASCRLPSSLSVRMMEGFMAIYEYKIGMKLPVSAQVAGEVCEELEQRNGLTPHNLVEVSRPEDAPTHGLFEWDDTVAAEKYREVQAQKVIRLIVKVPEKSKSGEPTRAFVSLTTYESERPESSYRSIDRVLRDASSREAMLVSARRELAAFQRKYSQFKELADVFRAIDSFAGSLLEEEVA